MRIQNNMSINISNIQNENFNFKNVLTQSYEELSNLSSKELTTVFKNIGQYLINYNIEFNNAFIEFNKKVQLGNTEAILKQSITSVDTKTPVSSISKLTQTEAHVQRMIQVMDKGHRILLDLRTLLTNSGISTNFVILRDGQLYQIDKKEAKTSLILTQYRGKGTIDNPFGLSYQISDDLIKNSQKIEEFRLQSLKDKEAIINSTEFNKKLLMAKNQYLEFLKEKNSKKGIVKEYKMRFDAKDAEILQHFLLSSQKSWLSHFTWKRYVDMRKQLGGDKPNAFYTLGDIGNIQVKFFNLGVKRKKAAAQFVSFKILRDRIRELSTIFQFIETNPTYFKQELLKFFTVNSNNIHEQVSIHANKVAKDNLQLLLKNI